MNEWICLAILLGVCALLCAVGFYKFVYFPPRHILISKLTKYISNQTSFFSISVSKQ